MPILFSTILFAAFALPQPRADVCFRADRDTVALTGRLVRRVYPGKPNFQSIKDGDEVEDGYYLELQRPICTEGPERQDNVSGVRTVQLVIGQRGYDALRPSLGKRATVQGTLFGSYTMHHHTHILLYVDEARLSASPRR